MNASSVAISGRDEVGAALVADLARLEQARRATTAGTDSRNE